MYGQASPKIQVIYQDYLHSYIEIELVFSVILQFWCMEKAGKLLGFSSYIEII